MAIANSFADSQKHLIEYNNQISEQLLEVLNPLFENTPVSTFGYGKMFLDGSMFFINTNKKWAQHFIQSIDSEKNYENTIKEHILKNQNYFLYSNKEEDLKVDLYSSRYEYDMWNSFNLYKKNSKYLEYIYLAGSRKESRTNDFYIQNLGLIDKFLDYFKLKARNIIETHDKNKLLILRKSLNITPAILKPKKELPQILKLKKILSIKDPDLFLTSREQDCATQLLMGQSAKEIARVLDLSPRTVETYLNNAKDKMGARNNVELAHLLTKKIERIT